MAHLSKHILKPKRTCITKAHNLPAEVKISNDAANDRYFYSELNWKLHMVTIIPSGRLSA